MSDDRWVLFDLDGTLLDYRAAEAAAVTATLTDAGVSATEDVMASYRRINAGHWQALERGETTAERLRVERWQDVLALHDPGGRIDAAGLAEHYLAALAAGNQLVAGAAEVVAQVATTHRIAYITNGLSDVQRPRLAASELAGTAEVLIISDEVGSAKPDPAIFEAVFDAMGGPSRDDVTMVGDSLTADIAGAVAFGLSSIWVALDATVEPDPGGPRPTHIVRDLRDLPPLLR